MMYVILITKFNALIVAGRCTTWKGWTHNGRTFNKNLLVYVEEGECTFFVNDQSYQLGKGDYVIIPKGVYYKPYTETSCRHCYFHFDGEFLEDCTSEKTRLRDIVLPSGASWGTVFQLPAWGKAPQEFALHLSAVMAGKESNSACQKMHMNLAFFNALNCIAGDDSSAHDQNPLANNIHQYIMEHLTEPLTLSEISSHFGYSKQHIISQFKKEYKLPPTSFILKKRLELSVTYLLETSLTISEISTKCGFNDSNYYSRAFRERYQVSPQNYRDSF